MTDFENPSVQLSMDIPQSYWVDKILPLLGYGKVRVLEVPVAPDVVGTELEASLEEIRHAEDYFNKGDYDKSVEHCRNAIEPIKNILPKLEAAVKSETKYGWVEEISSATLEWLNRIYKKTRDLTSKPPHLPSVGHFSRHDAEAIMLVTTALAAYVGRIST